MGQVSQCALADVQLPWGCFFPTQPSPLKSSWTNLPTEAEIYLGIKGTSPTPILVLAVLPFAPRDTQQKGTGTLFPCTQYLSRGPHCQTGLITSIFPLPPLKKGAWRILKLQERATGRQCSIEQCLKICHWLAQAACPSHGLSWSSLIQVLCFPWMSLDVWLCYLEFIR